MSAMAAPAVSPAAGASGSSFYAAMRLLPRAEREAMFAIYGFCRAVDDIADEPDPSHEERVAALHAWRGSIDKICADSPPPGCEPLAKAAKRFGLARADFVAVIEGMEMDVEGPIQAPAYADFDLYCDRVASAVGRLGVRVFGMDAETGERLAHHLGRALQFTNVLRDLDEDADVGRLYLPAEALDHAGLRAQGRTPADIVADPAIDLACRWLAVRARDHYRRADRVLDSRPAGRLAAPRLMSAVYRRLLDKMEVIGWAPPRARERLGKAETLALVLRHGWRA